MYIGSDGVGDCAEYYWPGGSTFTGVDYVMSSGLMVAVAYDYVDTVRYPASGEAGNMGGAVERGCGDA